MKNLEWGFVTLSGHLHDFIMVTTLPCCGTRRLWALLGFLLGETQGVRRQHWGHRKKDQCFTHSVSTDRSRDQCPRPMCVSTLKLGVGPIREGGFSQFQPSFRTHWLLLFGKGAQPCFPGSTQVMAMPGGCARAQIRDWSWFGHGRRQEQPFSRVMREYRDLPGAVPSHRAGRSKRQSQHWNQLFLSELFQCWRQGSAKPGAGVHYCRTLLLTHCQWQFPLCSVLLGTKGQTFAKFITEPSNFFFFFATAAELQLQSLGFLVLLCDKAREREINLKS